MSHLDEKLGKLLGHSRWVWLITMPLLVLIIASGMKNLQFTNNYRVFFSADNPELRAFESMERTYTQDDNVLFLLVPASGDVFQPQVLEAVQRLTEQAWQIPYSIRVDSLSNFQYTEAEADDLVVRDLVEDAAGLDSAAADRVRDIALSEPLLAERLVSKDGAVTVVNVTVQFPRLDEIKEVPEVVAAARDIAEEIRKAYPDIEVHLTGMAMLNNAFSEASQADMQALVPISFALMLVILGLMVRSLLGVLATVLVIVMSVMVGMGTGGLMGFPITPATASAPTAIMTLAIASSVHVLVSFYQELSSGANPEQAMSESLRINLQPVVLTGVTTAIGFLSLTFSEVPPFVHLGVIVAAGVVASFVLALTFLPALVLVLPVKTAQRGAYGKKLMTSLGDFVVTHRRRLLIATGIPVLISVAFLPRNELNDVFVHYMSEEMEFRQASDALDRHLGGMYRVYYSLDTGESGGVSDPRYLTELDAFADWLRQQPEVTHVASIADIFKRLNKNLHGDDPAWYRLPESREMAAQYLLLYEMSLPYGLDLNNQVDVDKAASRLMVSMHILSTNEVLALDQRAQDWLQANAPHLATEGSSPTVMFAHIGSRNIRSMLLGTSLALVLISMVLVLAFRSVKIGLLSMVPNLVPAAVGFGIWGLMVGEVGLSLSVVTGMTLGIVVDDTVHFLSKYLRARKEQGLSSEEAVRYAFSTVGSALLITTVVLVMGFLVLALSNFYLNAGMGLLTAMVLGLALLADFFFLPPLLMKIEEKVRA